MEDKRIENFVQSERGAGTFRSEGQFTLRAETAQRKAAQHQLSPGAWAVKVLQCLIAARTKRIDVSFGKTHTTFHFELPRLWSRDCFLSIFEADLRLQRYLVHLKVALTSLVFGEKRDVQVRCFEGGVGFRWDDDWVLLPSSKSPKKSRLSITVSHLSSTESKELGWLAKSRLTRTRYTDAEYAVRGKLMVAEPQVTIDGRALNYAAQTLEHLARRNSSPLYSSLFADSWVGLSEPIKEECLVKRGRNSSLPKAPIKDSKIQSLFMETNRRSMDYFRRGPDSKQSDVLKRRSVCYWLCDGVIVGSDYLSIPALAVYLSVYACGEDLDTDLSSLSLLENEKRKEALHQAEVATRDFLVDRELRFPEVERKRENKFSFNLEHAYGGGQVGGVLCMVAGALVTAVFPTLATPILAKSVLAIGGASGAVLGGVSKESEVELENWNRLEFEYERALDAWKNP